MREVAKLIVFDGTQLLLLKKKTNKLRFSLLGGGVKKKETPEEAVLREAKEEGNIEIGSQELTKVKSIVNTNSIEGTTVYHYYLINRVESFELLEVHKFDALEWVEYNYGLAKLKPRDRKVIEKFIIKTIKK